MTTSKSLPARPSLESLRKQAKKLARGIAAGDGAAIARARAQLPQAELPLSQRDAQLVLRPPWVLGAWALHIVCDIFTHPLWAYPTPYLWPITTDFVDGTCVEAPAVRLP